MKKSLLIVAIAILLLLSYPTLYTDADDTGTENINNLSLREKIGQIMFIGFQGKDLTHADIEHFEKIGSGGIVFYARNFKDASDIPALITKIKSIFKNHELPIFFAIDQEGGIVHRIEGDYYKPPSGPALGAANSEGLTEKVGRSVGNSLRNLGININLAPVLDMPADISSSPMTMRSFGNDPKTVERLGIAYIKGLKSTGLLSAAKHFPGIGRTPDDSHSKLPHIIWKTQNEKDNDIMPFKGAIKAGVDVILVGHFLAEPGDRKNPISLSPYWMSNVLRKDMGFDGLIIVDNIEMKPIEELMSVTDAAVQSFKAGADIIMVSHEREKQDAVFHALLNAVEKGEISPERLNESLRRIVEAKKRIMFSKAPQQTAHTLKDISIEVAENSLIMIKEKDAPSLAICEEGRVLYAGYSLTLWNDIKNTFRHKEILNTTLPNYKKMHPKVPIKDFLKKFDLLIIDADYTDASDIISLCNRLDLKYFVVQGNVSNIRKTIEKLKPRWLIIILDNSRLYLQVVAEILGGRSHTKVRIPYNFILPANYIYN